MSWNTALLKDLCTKIGSGSTPKGGGSVYIAKGVSLIRSQNVYNLRFDYEGLAHINEAAAKKLNNVIIEENDVLINITGDSVARTCVVPKDVLPARVNQHVAILRPNSVILNSRFLNYYLATSYMQAFMLNLAVGKGASRNAMTKSMLEGFSIPLPAIETQNRIANILSRYDDLIENYQKQIKLLEEAAQRIYKEWFVDFHFPGHENVKIVNGVPEGWEKMKLGDIAYESGQKISKKSRNAYDYYLPIDCLPKQSLTYIQYNPIEEAESSLVSFKKNDIIFGAMRPYFHKVVFAQSRGVTRTTCFVLNSIKSDYWGYLLVLLFSEETIKYAAKISVGTTMPYVRWKDFSNMEIIKPSLFVAQKIQFIMSSLINQLTLYSKQVRLLIEARDRLLPKLMSGEIEV